MDSAYGESYYRSGAKGAGYEDYLAGAESRLSGFRAKLSRIERYAERKGAILDYGCAVGLFVKVAKDGGWTASGCDRSVWAVEYGKRVLKLDLFQYPGSERDIGERSLDAVTLWDAIEHLVNPAEVIEAIGRWLRPGGLLAVSTVNSSSVGARLAGPRWRHLSPPLHLQYFSRRSLLRLLSTRGFEVKRVTSDGVCFTSDVLHADDGGWRARADEVLGHHRIARLLGSLNVLDELEVIAVKQG